MAAAASAITINLMLNEVFAPHWLHVTLAMTGRPAAFRVVVGSSTTWARGSLRSSRSAHLLTLMRQGGWKRLQMVERYSHAIPLKDRSALPNPLAEAKVVSSRRAAQVV